MTADELLSIGLSRDYLRERLTGCLVAVADEVSVEAAVKVAIHFDCEVLERLDGPPSRMTALLGDDVAERVWSAIFEGDHLFTQVPRCTFRGGTSYKLYEAIALFEQTGNVNLAMQKTGCTWLRKAILKSPLLSEQYCPRSYSMRRA